ncbi:DUF4124 domain-containing protein [Ottowia thiooxydans]|uniref:DUF4124 domain-containing protein n=1 Tax=Ottowia thiooxydans TaxID=219182 RepID=UPI000403F2D3|nr:DUF4124 domain-containing protein [Ottowia thiooxydans]
MYLKLGSARIIKAVVAAVFLTLMASASNAQVHRCKGPDGKLAYSDAPCANTSTGGVIKLQENTIETQMDWERNERYIQQQQQQQQQPTQQPGRPVVAAPATRTVPTSNDRDSPGCQLAIRNANTQSASASPAKIDNDRAEASRVCGFNPWPGKSASEIDAENRRSRAIERAARSQPSVISRCDDTGCWDNMGVRYNGSGQTLFRPDGQACRRVGNTLECF